jgi:hypothetical protein
MREEEAQRLRQAAVDRLGFVLEGELVGEEQAADARRIAAAPEVLQKQRVIEFPDLVFIDGFRYSISMISCHILHYQ